MGKINIKKAFTLAEMLIVLVLIGIIATITIGIIKPYNANQKGYEELAMKSQGDLAQAFTQMILNDSNFDDLSTMKDESGNFSINSDGAVVRFVKIIKKYIQDNGKLVDTTKEKVYFDMLITHYNSTKTNKKITDKFSNFYFANNGVLFGFQLNSSCSVTEDLEYLAERKSATSVENTCGSFFIDVNGYQKPNRLGSDQYIIPFDAKFLKFI